MHALWRTTVLGAVIRIVTRGRYLAFPDQAVHYRAGSSTETSDSTQARLKKEFVTDKAIVVDWLSDTDEENPRNWSTTIKVYQAAVICMYTFTVYCGSSIYVPSEEQIMNVFGVSQTVASLGLALYVLGYGIGPLLFSPLSEIPAIGRNPIYALTFTIFILLSIGTAVVKNFAGFLVLRFLQGFFGSPCLATGAASLSDMFDVIKTPYLLAAWSGSMYFGPALGPVISAFAVTAESWRWSMWEIVWLSAFIYVLLLSTLPETSAPTILYYRTKRLNRATASARFISVHDSKRKQLSAPEVVKLALVKPFEITIKDPAIAFTNFYTSLTYGIYYSFFEVFGIVYTGTYGFSLGDTGAVFLCILIAALLGIATYCSVYAVWLEPSIKKHGLVNTQEIFLRPGLAAVFGVTAGLFLFGWAAQPEMPWPVPTLGIVCYCGCSFVVGLGIFIYLPLSYPQYAASLFAANDALRSSFAAAAILFGRPLYVNLGVGRACSLLGGLSVLGISGLWYLYAYGESLRKRSRFTAD